MGRILGEVTVRCNSKQLKTETGNSTLNPGAMPIRITSVRASLGALLAFIKHQLCRLLSQQMKMWT